jgi:predicted RNA binding protein YcfA (HicA-like mRNA interferase family)
MTFAEVEQILRDFGMHPVRTKGSHPWFKGAGIGQIPIPKAGGRWVEEVYLDDICRLLKLDELDLNELDN